MRMRGGNLEKVHIKMHNETCHSREFIAAPVISTDPYSSDTQTPNDQDECTNPIEDADTRQELHWYKYLEGLRSTVWGDHTATWYATHMNPDMETIRTSYHTLIGVVFLGLMVHALEKIVHHPTLGVNNDYQLTSDINSREGDPQASTEDYEKKHLTTKLIPEGCPMTVRGGSKQHFPVAFKQHLRVTLSIIIS